MNKLMIAKSVLLIGGVSLFATGCVVRETRYSPPPPAYAAPAGGEVYVSGPPPAPIVETVTVAPAPGFIWVGGFWGWDGGRWGWRAGHWDRPPRVGAVWVGPRYAYRGGRHVWVRGGWR